MDSTLTETKFNPSVHIRAATTDRVQSDLEEITVCICTYRRPELLKRLLDALAIQRTEGQFTFCCAIVDNDGEASAQPIIESFRSGSPLIVRYVVEPTRNFAVVRNRALGLVSGKLLAFIDDDEVPQEDWLLQLWRTMQEYQADAVLGPVRPYFERDPPAWIVKGRICERQAHPTGTKIHWSQTRTGNVLLRAAIATECGINFDPAFGSGGEDVDFFKRAAGAGKSFVWCEEAPAYELVPEARLTRRYHLKRALLQGSVSSKYAAEKSSFFSTFKVASKALVAAIAYSLALPFLFLAGDHIGMKFLIKDCHHIARLLAIFRLRQSARRDF